VLGVRHEPDDVALRVRHAGDVVRRPVRVAAVRVAQDDAHRFELLGRRVVAAGLVLDRDRQHVPGRARRRPRRRGVDHLHTELPADEPAAGVRQQRSRQQPCLAQHLEAVADAEHGAALARERRDRVHHRREAGDRADAQVVAVRESAREDDRVHAAEVAVAVPEQLRVADARGRVQRVDVVARAREPDDGDQATTS
jgi:hypothetical protein